ncbi:E3 binding domain-containing protein [Geodermatophilus sp. SYSU D00079]
MSRRKGEVRATPTCRRLAAELGVNLVAVKGTGEGGRVRLQDVRAAAQPQTEAAQPPAPRLRLVPPAPRSLTVGGLPAQDRAIVNENAGAAGSYEAREVADARGVALRRVTGTGPRGEVTVADVRAAADLQDAERAAWHAAASPQAQPEPEPRIAFTASGLPVSVLAQVPAPVRRAVAAAATHAEAYALVQRYQGKADTEARALLAQDRQVSVDYGGSGPTRRSVPGWE